MCIVPSNGERRIKRLGVAVMQICARDRCCSRIRSIQKPLRKLCESARFERMPRSPYQAQLGHRYCEIPSTKVESTIGETSEQNTSRRRSSSTDRPVIKLLTLKKRIGRLLDLVLPEMRTAGRLFFMDCIRGLFYPQPKVVLPDQQQV